MTRLLRPYTALDASAPASTSASNGYSVEPLLAQLDAAPLPVILVLDQFEQFFLHYGHKEQQDPFLSFLNLWWTRHPSSQLRILISIREDYFGKLALIQERLEYTQTVHNHLRLQKFRPDDAVEVLRTMATENDLPFHEAAVRHACREQLASPEDGNVSPVDLQILATGVRDLPDPSVRGFTAEALRSLGGLEGALERYLLTQLDTVYAHRSAALAVLRLLSELRQGVLAGWLSAAEIIERLGPEHGALRVEKMVAWLAAPGVRLIVETATPDGRRYRLVHDRLVAAVRKVSDQVLEQAERASLLLNQRVTEYLSNRRSSRFLLPWREWRFIRRHQALADWGSLEAEKRELLFRSGRRVKVWGVSVFAFATALCLGWGAWEFQPKVLLWRTQWELASNVQRLQYISDNKTLRSIATALAKAGEEAKDVKLIEQAAAVAEKIGEPSTKASALRSIATALAKVGEEAKDAKLIEQAAAVAERIGDPIQKAYALSSIRVSLGDLRGARRAVRSLPTSEHSLALVGIIGRWAEGHSAAAMPTR